MSVMSAAPQKTARRAADHSFYYAVAIFLAVLVFAGFARTYYLREIYSTRALPLLLHLHGAVMTLWYALFILQVRLAAIKRIDLHRRLGLAGVILAGMVAVLATIVSLGLARRDLQSPPDAEAAPILLAFQLFGMVLIFLIFISLALYLRHRRDYHKRLMVLAMLSLLGPALTRLPLPFVPNHNVLVAIILSISCLLLCVLTDTFRNRRLHPAFGWGGALSIGSIFIVGAFAQSSVWTRLVRYVLL